MYLLLVENSFISSREIKSLLDKNSIKCEVVNCSSGEALLDIAEKLAPDIVIIDFDFYIDDSAEIVRELRKHNDEAYIFAFIDPDHYEKIYQAIEMGIDDYLVKPLQREDVMLRIKMGLQRKTSQVKKPAASAIRDQVDSTKLLKDIADAFGQEYGEAEKTFFSTESAEDITAQPAEDDYSDLEYISEIQELADQDIPAVEDAVSDEFAEQEVAEVTEETEEDEYSDNLFTMKLEPDLEDEAEEEYESLSEPQSEQDSFIIDEPADDELSNEVELEEDQPSKARSEESYTQLLMEQVETDLPEPEEKADDLQYLDQLFGLTDGEEEADVTEESKEKVSEEQSLPELEESRMAFREESPDRLEDSELFGVKKKDRQVDTKSFEEIFGSKPAYSSKKVKFSPGLKDDKGKQGKVEYLFSAKKPADTEQETTAGELPIEQLRDEEKLSATPEKKSGKDSEIKGSRVTRIFGNIVTALLLVIMVTMSFYLIQSRIGGGTPSIAGYKAYVVLSGSMSPAFNTGSLIFVKPAEPSSIAVGDIITFGSAGDASRLTTHRVVGTNWDNGLSFITRGDANNVNDPNPVPSESVVGRVTGYIPYIGYLLGYAQTRQGLIILIFIPGALILLFELRRLFGYMVEAKVEKLTAASSAVPASAAYEANNLERDTAFGDFDFSGSTYRKRSK